MTSSTYSPNEMFSSRATIEEAVEFSQELINTLPIAHRMAATTALWVSLNTALKEIDKKSLSSVIPFDKKDMPPNLRVEDMTPELATKIVRSTIILALDDCRIISGFPVLGQLVEPVTIFIMMVSRMFNLSVDDILAEVKADPLFP